VNHLSFGPSRPAQLVSSLCLRSLRNEPAITALSTHPRAAAPVAKSWFQASRPTQVQLRIPTHSWKSSALLAYERKELDHHDVHILKLPAAPISYPVCLPRRRKGVEQTQDEHDGFAAAIIMAFTSLSTAGSDATLRTSLNGDSLLRVLHNESFASHTHQESAYIL
jgi:hypothetical protein